ncbi:ROK family transcriptional regulator [Agrococcus sp. ARC_14]|uniref:ROK family transcriptional regulator n=1 Tax=Agrococcus sp. ARC_14 TaxID=2919927 RepID=UPI001F05DB5C|nr:ROK family transcriptional regulator [Agrococcus sp. ARC_14]MCH1884282.1 ROK family protein [Agrococcus sp. ARC_14]
MTGLMTTQSRARRDAAIALPHDAFAMGARRRAKVLPEHARAHNRTLVLQTLLDAGPSSRADLARATMLTRVTVSDLVAELLREGLLVELGPSEAARPGKPATLLDLAHERFELIALDLSEPHRFRGAVVRLDGTVAERLEREIGEAVGDAALEHAIELGRALVARAQRTVLGIGVGTPGIVDADGVVHQAPNLGWHELPMRERLAEALALPVHVANDANIALLAELSSSGAETLLVVRIGLGVGAGVAIAGMPVRGDRSAAGEIGHVTIGTDGGPRCACGRDGCLEAWLSAPRLRAAIEEAGPAERERVLEEAGRRLGIAVAPIVGAIDVRRIVMSGPADLVAGTLLDAAATTLRERTLDEGDGIVVAMTEHGDDVVVRGAALLVRAGELGVS